MRAGLNPFIHGGNLTSTSFFLFVSHPFTAPQSLYIVHDLSIVILHHFLLRRGCPKIFLKSLVSCNPLHYFPPEFLYSAQKPPTSKSPGDLIKSRSLSPTSDHPHYHLQVWGPGFQVLTKSSAKACVLN